MKNTYRSQPRSPRTMRGLSIVELMIALTLGLIVLAALASIFASSSAARTEMERTTRQLENGRFAMELLSDDLRLAGFYGELNVSGFITPAALPDVCSLDPAVWNGALTLAVQGFDAGATLPTCVPASIKSGTDVLVVRFANSCEAGTTNCETAVGGKPYVQVSKCSNTTPPENLATPYELGLSGTAGFALRLKDCLNRAGLRRYYVRIYFVSTDNGKGQAIPTLKRLDLDGAVWTETALVEGIEELNIEYGIDTTGDGGADDYNTDPTTFAKAGCATCTAPNNWFNVVTARINLLARNLEPSLNYTDTKTYTLGRDAAGNEITRTPGGNYRRHAYTSVVRLINVGQRREKPA